jgi:hypothetical protein
MKMTSDEKPAAGSKYFAAGCPSLNLYRRDRKHSATAAKIPVAKIRDEIQKQL